MASSFSWSDTIQVTFGSCLPCIKPKVVSEEDSQHNEIHNPAINRIPRARPDELQGLLADPDTDVEAETMSLHSNPGRSAVQRGKKKKRRTKKGSSSSGTNNSHRITLFGYNLFGNPAIQLPEDSEDALYPDSRRNARNGSTTPTTILTAHSTSTFDSDAAPLDTAAIDALSSPTAAAAAIETAAQTAAAAEAQRLREKEERRQKRREKGEMKKLAEALARQASGDVVGDGEFEGFQGSGANVPSKSGSGYPRIPNTMYSGQLASDSGSGSGFSGSARDGFGQFVSAPALPVASPYLPQNEDDDNDAADLDGALYARKPRDGQPGGGGSDSRSRTSASTSDRAHQFPDPRNVFRHIHSHSQSHSQSSSRVNSPSYAQLQFQAQPDFASSNLAPASTPDSESQQRKKKSKSKSKTSSSRTHSSTTSTSQSPSLPSPVSPSFPASVHVQENQIVSPSTVEQGQGFFDLEDELPVRKVSAPALNLNAKPASEFPSARIGGGGGFPMTGFGGGGGVKRTRDFGAFLARRGDGDDEDGEGL